MNPRSAGYSSPVPQRGKGARHNAERGRVRIIGGRWRRHRLEFPPSPELRPTPDRVRETLFNWLAPRIEGAHCLDLFAGSGALGFEAASRGAAKVVMVDHDWRIIQCLRSHVRTLAADNIEVAYAEAIDFLRDPLPGARLGIANAGAHPRTSVGAFDIVFLDPPFGADLLETACHDLESNRWVRRGALVYLEAKHRAQRVQVPQGWVSYRSRRAGQVEYCLFECL